MKYVFYWLTGMIATFWLFVFLASLAVGFPHWLWPLTAVTVFMFAGSTIISVLEKPKVEESPAANSDGKSIYQRAAERQRQAEQGQAK